MSRSERMRVLVACEFSGVVRDASAPAATTQSPAICCRASGRGRTSSATSADHLRDGWDLLIAHPPCTFLANSGAKHLYLGCRRENGADGDRWANLGHAAAFFLDMLRAPFRVSRSRTRSCSGTSGGSSNPGAVAESSRAVRASRDQGDLPWLRSLRG